MKKKLFFTKWETANFIFVVESFDENQESIQDGAFNLSQYLYNNLGVKMEKSVLALFNWNKKSNNKNRRNYKNNYCR